MAASRRASLFPDFVGEMRGKIQARTWSRVFEDKGEQGLLAARMDADGATLLLDCIAAHGGGYGHYAVKVDEATFLTHVCGRRGGCSAWALTPRATRSAAWIWTARCRPWWRTLRQPCSGTPCT